MAIPLPSPLKTVLSLDGFVIFIEGSKGSGKTNLAILLLEICREHDLRNLFASNIEMKDPDILYINNYPDLDQWFKEEIGLKLFILDEAGKHLKRRRFMSNSNVKIMDIVQLIRHYDGGLIGIAPSSKLIDTLFLNTDLLDARIRKAGNKQRSKKIAKVYDIYNNEIYTLYDLPRTSIKHNAKTDAIFTMDKKVDIKKLPWCCQVAKRYVQLGSYRSIANQLGIHPEQVKREIIRHLKHS